MSPFVKYLYVLDDVIEPFIGNVYFTQDLTCILEFFDVKFILLIVRKIVTYLLLFLFIWQIVGFVGYFEISHAQIKKEIKTLIKKGVPKDELIIYTFDAKELSQLVWLKKNEFDLDGNLYDVVRRKTMENGKTTLECISDKQEKVLFAKLGQTISKNLGDDKHPSPVSSWMKMLQVPFLIVENNLNDLMMVHEENRQDYFIYSPFRSLISIEITSPPPCRFS
jgi:hypothetical protein